MLRLLGIRPPASPVFLELAALMVAGLSLTFLAAGLAPLRLRTVIGVAAAVRAADAVLLSSFVARRLLPMWVAALAAAELILAVLHFVYWLKLREGSRDAEAIRSGELESHRRRRSASLQQP